MICLLKQSNSWREKHYRNLANFSTIILTDSIIGKEHVIETFKASEDKVKVFPYTAPKQYRESHAINSIMPRDRNKMFYPAQYWSHKNHENLIWAFYNIINLGYSDLKLIFTGSNKGNYSNVKKLIEELKLSNNIILKQYISDEELLNLYMTSGCMIFPSFLGPTNIPPIEAAFTNCPILLSNIYSHREQTKGHALFFEPNSVESIGMAIKTYLTEPTLVNNLVQNYPEITEPLSSKNLYSRLLRILTD